MSKYSFPRALHYGLAGALALWVVELTGVWNIIERPLMDPLLRRDAWCRQAPDNALCLAVDSSTVVTHGENRWPFSRLAYATALQGLRPESPRAVAFEVPMSNPQPELTVFDDALASQVERFPAVVFSARAVGSGSFLEMDREIPALAASGLAVRMLPNHASAVFPLASFAKSSFVGFSSLIPELDGKVRDIPLVYRFADKVYPSFLLASVVAMEGVRMEEVELHIGEVLIRKSNEVTMRIPVDHAGRMLLRWRANVPPPPRVGLDAAVLAAEQKRAGEPIAWDPAEVRDKMVFISREDPRTYEPVATPLGPCAPMRVHWEGWRVIYSGDYMQIAPAHWRIGAYTLAAVVLCWVAMATPLWFSVPFALSALGGAGYGMLYLFFEKNMLCGFLSPLLLLPTVTVFGILWRNKKQVHTLPIFKE